MQGIVASGHVETSRAAQQTLARGGNAFDAAVSALLAACVAEPILTSLGGGGFLLAESVAGERRLFDFFAQTPGRQNRKDCEFFPISGDFGTTVQEFHIGMGSVAVPGLVDGLFEVQQQLCRLPMTVLAEPAIELANRGVEINPFQAYILRILEPIFRSRPELEALFTSSDNKLLEPPAIHRQPELAQTLEQIAAGGREVFYQGEIAATIVKLSQEHGGHIEAKDLLDYRTIIRSPLALKYCGATVLTNPVPSCGGTLIAHSLKLLERLRLDARDSDADSQGLLLARVMAATNLERLRAGLQLHPDEKTASLMLQPGAITEIIENLDRHPLTTRGTTQISVVDEQGNVASVTTSNGEGCGHLVPGTGIHLNNFLGEQDLMPEGFESWRTNRRMSSMMAPCIVTDLKGRRMALGSGGSNRLRSAITQVLIQLLDDERPLAAAVEAPRMHLEGEKLSIEPGFSAPLVQALSREFTELQQWDATNLYFGGVHVAALNADRQTFEGFGDPRRGGVCLDQLI